MAQTPAAGPPEPTDAATGGNRGTAGRTGKVIQTARERGLHYRTALVAVAAILLAVIVTLPFTLSSMWEEMSSPAEGIIVRLGPAADTAPLEVNSRLHLAIVSFDELQRLATVRVTGQHRCDEPCPWVQRLLLFSVSEDEKDAEGLPYSVAVTMPGTTSPVTQTVSFPMRGHPVRYPFDHYDLWLAVAYERQLPDGQVYRLAPGEEAGRWYLTVQERLPRLVMTQEEKLDPRELEDADNDRMDLHFALAERLRFERPMYLRVLTVLLVLLVTAAAAYAVFMRPLQDLVVNSGALVLGVWGIRGIISPGAQAFVSAVDLSLALVILFLLGAITVRAMQFFYTRLSASAAGKDEAASTEDGQSAAPAANQADGR